MDPTEVLLALLPRLPLLLIMTVGLVLAVVRWERHPLTSLLFALGAAIELVVTMVYAVVPVVVTSVSQMMPVFYVTGAVDWVGTALLVGAVFVERPVSATPQR